MPFSVNASRVLCINIYPSLKIRGLNRIVDLTFPDAALNAWHDYSVDFSGIIGDNRSIVEVEISASFSNIAWQTINGNSLITFFAQWTQSGSQSLTVSVRLDDGTTQTVMASIIVSSTASLINANASAFSPNAFLLSSSVFVQDSTQAQPLIMR